MLSTIHNIFINRSNITNRTWEKDFSHTSTVYRHIGHTLVAKPAAHPLLYGQDVFKNV